MTRPAPEALARTLRDVALSVVRAAPRHELSRTAASTLASLERGGPARITALAQQEVVSQPSMTGLVQRLEGLGYLTRASDPDDRRATLVAITAAGAAAVRHRRETHEQAIAARLARLTAEELRALSEAVPALTRLIDTTEDHVYV